MTRQMKLLFAAAAAAFVGQVSAQVSWTLDDNGPGTLSSQRVMTVLGGDAKTTATITGYANTGAGGGLAAQLQTSGNGVGVHIYSGGIGLKNQLACGTSGCDDYQEGTSPEHSFDNNQRFDFALVDFGSMQVNLTRVSIGWYSNDADITVLAYTGNGNPTLDGSTLGALAASGWQTIGNYAELQNRSNGTADVSGQTSGIWSSLWLIGAYSPDVGGKCYDIDTSGGCGTSSLDYVKFDWLKGYVRKPPEGGGVPEPGSLALLGLALSTLMLVARRRRV